MEKFKAVFVRFGEKGGRSFLYLAPYDERIKEGDRVVVNHKDNTEGQAIVVYSEDINLQYSTDQDQWEMFRKIAGEENGKIKRIKAVIKRTDFEYDDEEEESEDEKN